MTLKGKTVEEELAAPDLDRVMTDGRTSIVDDDVAPVPAAAAAPVTDADLLAGEPGGDLLPPTNPPPPEVPAAAPTPPVVPVAPVPPAAQRRFRDHDEAERGYKHLQQEKTLTEQRALALEEELRSIRSQEQLKKNREVEEREFTEFAQTRNEQALKEIDELDPDDPDYRKKAAAAWSRANKDIRFWQVAPPPPAAATPVPPAPPVPPVPPEVPAVPAPPAIPAGTATEEAARAHVNERLSVAGIPQDDRLFWAIAQNAPTTDLQGRPIDFEAQIDWALAETKTYRDQLLGTARATDAAAAAEAERKARAAQEQNLPLGRSAATGPVTEAPGNPVSMADAIHFAQERRRL